MRSTTKYIGGHGTSIGGIIVDGGNFDWEKHADRFPMLNQPDPSYHGAVWTQAVKSLGPIAYTQEAPTSCNRERDTANMRKVDLLRDFWHLSGPSRNSSEFCAH